MYRKSYITDPGKFISLMTDPTRQVVDVNLIGEEAVQVQYQYDEEFVPDSNITNVVLASFTAMWGRVRLYNVLDQLQERVLYYDTGKL